MEHVATTGAGGNREREPLLQFQLLLLELYIVLYIYLYAHIYIILILAYCNTQANNMRNIKGLYVMYPHAWYKTLTSHPNFILMRPAVWAQAGPVAQQTNATRTAT